MSEELYFHEGGKLVFTVIGKCKLVETISDGKFGSVQFYELPDGRFLQRPGRLNEDGLMAFGECFQIDAEELLEKLLKAGRRIPEGVRVAAGIQEFTAQPPAVSKRLPISSGRHKYHGSFCPADDAEVISEAPPVHLSAFDLCDRRILYRLKKGAEYVLVTIKTERGRTTESAILFDRESAVRWLGGHGLVPPAHLHEELGLKNYSVQEQASAEDEEAGATPISSTTQGEVDACSHGDHVETARQLANGLGYKDQEDINAASTFLSAFRKKNPNCARDLGSGQGVKKSRYVYFVSQVRGSLEEFLKNRKGRAETGGTPAEQEKTTSQKAP